MTTVHDLRATPEQAAELRAAAGIDPFPDYRPDPAARAECQARGWIRPDGTLTGTGHEAMRTFAESYGTRPTGQPSSYCESSVWWAGQ